jgi:hypothetical protein
MHWRKLMALTEKQHGVVRGIVPALAVSVTGIAGAIWLSPGWLIPGDDPAGRIAFVMRWDLLVVFWLIVQTGALARLRFFSPEDIDGGGMSAGTAAARKGQAILQNTLEQVVLAVFVHVAWAAIMPVRALAAIPVAAVLFAIGRALFWRGYGRGAAGRALGFGLTFYPSALMFLILAVAVILRPAG